LPYSFAFALSGRFCNLQDKKLRIIAWNYMKFLSMRCNKSSKYWGKIEYIIEYLYFTMISLTAMPLAGVWGWSAVISYNLNPEYFSISTPDSN
jgi:hypothetical protein